jgi:hypothetical protein
MEMFYAYRNAYVQSVQLERTPSLASMVELAQLVTAVRMYLMRMNQTMKLPHTMHKVPRVGADSSVKILDEDVEDSADCASSVHVSEEDVSSRIRTRRNPSC